MLQTKLSGSMPCGFRREYFLLYFLCISLYKHVTRGNILNKVRRGLQGDGTYQISRLYALWFQTRRFDVFSRLT